jgi:glycyl-tRNA synthetase
MKSVSMEKLVNVSKQYGFIFQGSEIYGGLANTWDYGPLGVELKNNIKKAWWQRFINENMNSYGVDAAILMNPVVWKASGHIDSFSDPLVDCKDCKTRHRADHLIENFDDSVVADKMSNDEMINFIRENNIKCPNCGKSNFTDIREFNLMFKTERGVTVDNKSTVYLRPETAQGEFVNFLNVQRTMRAKIPFGIGQIGKAFRNEITPGNFTFRTIEFEQMEHQFFCKPGTDSDFYQFYKQKEMDFFVDLGINKDKLRFHDHDKLAHYAKEACDVEYEFDFGFGEIGGTHNRTDYDLKRHEQFSEKVLQYLDPETNEKYTPYVIESSIGCDRATLAFLADAYREEVLEDGSVREVMSFHPFIAPYKLAILPLVKKYHSEKALDIFKKLSKNFMCTYDETGNIGKRYRRQDVAGTPFCLTVDDDTINNGTVTIRNRDTMEQVTLNIDDVVSYVNEKLIF